MPRCNATIVGMICIVFSLHSAGFEDGDIGSGEEIVDVVLFSSESANFDAGCDSELHKELQLKLDGFKLVCLAAQGPPAIADDSRILEPPETKEKIPLASIWIWVSEDGELWTVRLGSNSRVIFSDISELDPASDISALYVRELVVMKWNIKPQIESRDPKVPGEAEVEEEPEIETEPEPELEPEPEPEPEPEDAVVEVHASKAASRVRLIAEVAGIVTPFSFGGESWTELFGGRLALGMSHVSGFQLGGTLAVQGRRWSPTGLENASVWCLSGGFSGGFLFSPGRFVLGPILKGAIRRTALKLEEADFGEFSYAWWRFSIGAGPRAGIELSKNFVLFTEICATYFFGRDSVQRESDGNTAVQSPLFSLDFALGLAWKK